MVMRRRNETGQSLVTVMVAVAVLGTIAVVMSRMMSNGLNANRHVELRGDLESMRRVLAQSVDCTATLTAAGGPGTCSTSSFFALRDRNNNVIGAPSFGAWKLGAWHVRSHCAGNRLNVQYARATSSTAFASDPLHPNVTYDWTYGSTTKPLFPTNELACDAFFGTATTCTAPPGYYCNYTTADGTYKIVAADLTRDPSINACSTLGSACAVWYPGETDTGYFGTITCPAGYKVASGGANCNSVGVGGPFAGDQAGVTESSFIADPAGQSWKVKCCKCSKNGLTITAAAFAACVKAN